MGERGNGKAGGSGNSITANAIRNLVSNWLTGDNIHPAATSFLFDGDGPENDSPVIPHINQITKRAHLGKAAPLLSMPTHFGGWIDPEIWALRLAAAEASGSAFDPLDICLSLLRLAPDRRKKALMRAEQLSGDIAPLARFALGGDAGPKFSDRKDHMLWISAARAREPLADWSEYFTPLKLRGDAPNALAPALHRWRAGLTDNDNVSRPFLDMEITGGNGPLPNASLPVDQGAPPILPRREMGIDLRLIPSAILTRLAANVQIDMTGWERYWLYNIWPQNTESLLFSAAAKFVGTESEVSLESRRMKGWQPLIDLDTLTRKYHPWREGAHLLLVTALGSEFGDTRRASIDLLIRGIDYRLFDPEIFVRILSELAAAGWEKHKYWGEGMLDAARFSPLHATVIGQCVESWLAQSNAIRNYAHLPLEILTHVHTVTGLPLRSTTLQKLRLLKGRTKAAKLANYLIKSQPVHSQP